MMAAKPLKERPLHELLDGLLVSHRQDIHAFSGGHLNEANLPKPPSKASHRSWASAKKPQITMQPKSHRVKSLQKDGKKKEGQMTETMMHFSLGTSSNAPAKFVETKAKFPRVSKVPVTVTRENSTASQGSYSQRDDGILVEEITLSQTMLANSKCYASKAWVEEDSKQEQTPRDKPMSQALLRDRNLAKLKSQMTPNHMHAVTKRDKFSKMKEYESDILKKQDSTEQNVLTGMKAVEHLELKLHQDLTELEQSGLSGPTFHSLQAYSNTFDDLLKDSPTFGYILSTIKKEYDEYVAMLLDTQTAKHQVLYEQVEKLSRRGTSNPYRLRKATDRVDSLEKEAKKQLEENERLRKELAAEQSLAAQPAVDPLPVSTIYGQEPSPELTQQIETLHTAIMSKLDELNELRTRLRKEFVPSTVCTHLEQCIKETEVEIQKLTSQKEYFERSIADMEKDLQGAIEEADTTERDARRVWKRIEAVKSTEKSHKGDANSDDESDSESKWSWYIS